MKYSSRYYTIFILSILCVQFFWILVVIARWILAKTFKTEGIIYFRCILHNHFTLLGFILLLATLVLHLGASGYMLCAVIFSSTNLGLDTYRAYKNAWGILEKNHKLDPRWKKTFILPCDKIGINLAEKDYLKKTSI
jgi:hypothetical protein